MMWQMQELQNWQCVFFSCRYLTHQVRRNRRLKLKVTVFIGCASRFLIKMLRIYLTTVSIYIFSWQSVCDYATARDYSRK